MDDRAGAAREPGHLGDRLGRRLVWLMAARLVLCLSVLGVSLALQAAGRSLGSAAENGLYATLAVAFLISAVLGWGLALGIRPLRSPAAQLVADLAIATSVVLFSGGEESLFTFLYVPIVVYGALLGGLRGAFAAAAGGSLGYGGLLLATHLGWLPRFGEVSGPTAGPVLLVYWSVHTSALFLVAVLARALSHELRSADEELDASQMRLELLRNLHERTVESLGSGLLTTDAAGVVTSFNCEGERILGRPVASALGRDVEELLPGIRGRVLQAVGAGPRARSRERMAFTNPDGEGGHLGLAASTLRGEDGSPAGTVVIFQDVTRVVEMEEELRRNERLAAVGRLSAAIAHEIRNPLAAISGSVQMLSGDGGKGSDERLLSIVLRETDRLNRLITEFLQYAHPRPPALEPVSLAELFEDVLGMFGTTQGQEVRVRSAVEPGLAALADAAQLRQLIWNLCLNGVQAMPEGGELRVEAYPAGIPQERAQAGRNDGQEIPSAWVELCVADTGVGMSQHVRDHLFDPFFTTKPDGTGLGLATVHRIVESHGGVLRVESQPGAGTRFCILLARAKESM